MRTLAPASPEIITISEEMPGVDNFECVTFRKQNTLEVTILLIDQQRAYVEHALIGEKLDLHLLSMMDWEAAMDFHVAPGATKARVSDHLI